MKVTLKENKSLMTDLMSAGAEIAPQAPVEPSNTARPIDCNCRAHYEGVIRELDLQIDALKEHM